MKILWITNIIFPEACSLIGIKPPVMGGWMLACAQSITKSGDIELGVATVYNGKKLKVIHSKNITYFLLPKSKSNIYYDKSLEKYWISIKETFCPEVVHIHGTEYAHGLAYIKSCGAKNVVISIQGLVSVYARYFYAGISFWNIIKTYTLRDILKGGIIKGKQEFIRRGNIEKEYIKCVNHTIGRTEWDKSHILAINPNSQYHFCNETLRSEFYKHHWEYNKCEKYSIFLSQAGYPIKGLHKVLEAIELVKLSFPNVKVYIAGPDITKYNTIKEKMKMIGYAKYIKYLIKRYNIEDQIIFLGELNEVKMVEQYLKANLFICPSAIENSPNSLGEAQILGVPCIASYVGGIPDMIPNESCGYLYRFEENEMLADKICKIFKTISFDNLEMIDIAKKRHSIDLNAIQLKTIYSKVKI